MTATSLTGPGRSKSAKLEGQRLKFVEALAQSNFARKTFFPLHTLRVSVLTSLALDAEVPLVVLSQLVAGHCRLFMTLYYTKVGVVRMTDVLNEATDSRA